MSDNDVEEVFIRKQKKGIRATKSYKKNIIKQTHVEGTYFTNWTGNFVEPKNTPAENIDTL